MARLSQQAKTLLWIASAMSIIGSAGWRLLEWQEQRFQHELERLERRIERLEQREAAKVE